MVSHSPDIAVVELNRQFVGQSETVRRKIQLYGAKPLGRRLLERYGTQQVGLVSLENCDDPAIPNCFLE